MSDATSVGGGLGRRRWLILGVIGLAQLMVVLDLTVMNIALPSAQRALHFTTVDRQWVVTAYTLAFGSLLLPGGRLADLLGRKVMFLTGLAGFAGVSAIGGASVNIAMLITARACQGAFAALLVPSALSLLTTTFTEQKAGTTMETKREVDPLMSRDNLQSRVTDYTSGQDAALGLISPIFADLSGLPPLIIQVGTHEVLLDDAVRLARQAAIADVCCRLSALPRAER